MLKVIFGDIRGWFPNEECILHAQIKCHWRLSVESFFYYMAKIYDIEVYYTKADVEQVKRLAKLIPVHKYIGKPIECDKLYSNYRFSAETTTSDKYHLIHYDPLNVGFSTTYEDGWKYIGVSKVACKGYEAKTGHKAELIYNPVPIEKKGLKKYDGLNLISATRLTSEKGLKRIVKLSNLLDKAGINYTWTIYTNRVRQARNKISSKNVILKEQTLNIHDEIEKSSWLIQLSDCESFGLSVCEALILGTPVIITDLEAFKEIGCIHGKNAVVCNFDMTNVDIDMIVKGLPKFEYTPPKSEWDKYLSRNKIYNPNELIEVTTKKRFWDLETNNHYIRNEKIKVSRKRASELECLDIVEVL